MTINHAAEAKLLTESVACEEDTSRLAAVATLALAHATIAHAEEQRTANLIAYYANRSRVQDAPEIEYSEILIRLGVGASRAVQP